MHIPEGSALCLLIKLVLICGSLGAKVVGPLFSSEARGRVGGLIFNTWRGVATVKAKVAPAQPRTSLQLAVRAIAVKLARLWASNANQGDWDTYAYNHPTTDGMGNSVRATGANWYVALNTRLLRVPLAAVETPPVVAAPAAAAAFVLTGGAGSLGATWTAMGSTLRCELWVDGPHSAGRKGSLPKAKFKDRPEGSTGTYDFGSPLKGAYTVFARAMSETDGQVSPWVSGSALVT